MQMLKWLQYEESSEDSNSKQTPQHYDDVRNHDIPLRCNWKPLKSASKDWKALVRPTVHGREPRRYVDGM